MARAMESGNATTPTTTPANTSFFGQNVITLGQERPERDSEQSSPPRGKPLSDDFRFEFGSHLPRADRSRPGLRPARGRNARADAGRRSQRPAATMRNRRRQQYPRKPQESDEDGVENFVSRIEHTHTRHDSAVLERDMRPREYEQGAERRHAHESPGQNVRHVLDASSIHRTMREKEHAERLANRSDQGRRDDEQAYGAIESATGRPAEVCGRPGSCASRLKSTGKTVA